MGDPRQSRARQIQDAIRSVLYRYWDPIGGFVPRDEYDRYIGGVYRLLVTGASDELLIEHLEQVSPDGIQVGDTRLRFVVKKLKAIDVRIGFTI